MPANTLPHTNWFSGPEFLQQPFLGETAKDESFELIEPEKDQEIRPQVATLVRQCSQACPCCKITF